ncbi:DUF2384 domain-containing protein [Gordonia sp. zg691]|nr:antitoxin Xre/MbcA/ParS toxin-binding domain-containing protein [Gordonia jinghuaiqii]MBD0862889.1 DUF2384 domain-containing protein [Gordonia jinghuaiqii]
MTRYLRDRLGRTLTAYIADTRNRTMPEQWASPPRRDRAQPGEENSARLQATYIVLAMIEAAENDDVARSWLISANPRLDGHSPAEFIRIGRIPAVISAATSFVNDEYYA